MRVCFFFNSEFFDICLQNHVWGLICWEMRAKCRTSKWNCKITFVWNWINMPKHFQLHAFIAIKCKWCTFHPQESGKTTALLCFVVLLCCTCFTRRPLGIIYTEWAHRMINDLINWKEKTSLVFSNGLSEYLELSCKYTYGHFHHGYC